MLLIAAALWVVVMVIVALCSCEKTKEGVPVTTPSESRRLASLHWDGERKHLGALRIYPFAVTDDVAAEHHALAAFHCIISLHRFYPICGWLNYQRVCCTIATKKPDGLAIGLCLFPLEGRGRGDKGVCRRMEFDDS